MSSSSWSPGKSLRIANFAACRLEHRPPKLMVPSSARDVMKRQCQWDASWTRFLELPPPLPFHKSQVYFYSQICLTLSLSLCVCCKAAALCAIVPALQQCVRAETAQAQIHLHSLTLSPTLSLLCQERQKCALQSNIQMMIMGEGPDTGDMGLVDDFKMCCDRGSTDTKPFSNRTCMRLYHETKMDSALAFHQKYWGCVSPGTKTTPRGNWTDTCDALPEAAAQLINTTLHGHDTFLKPCLSRLNVPSSQSGRCLGSGNQATLAPLPLRQMWDDWQSIAFADHESDGVRYAKSCQKEAFKPGCGGPAPQMRQKKRRVRIWK